MFANLISAVNGQVCQGFLMLPHILLCGARGVWKLANNIIRLTQDSYAHEYSDGYKMVTEGKAQGYLPRSTTSRDDFFQTKYPTTVRAPNVLPIFPQSALAVLLEFLC